jgi:mercuric reductase
MPDMYDVIVLGAGTAGINAAHAASEAGARVLLVNDGPTVTACASRNCMPSKALLAATHVAHTARHAAPFGIAVPGPVVVDFPRLVAQVQEQVQLFTRSVEEGVKKAVAEQQFDLLRGRASFMPDGYLRVHGRTLKGHRYVIATGSVVAVPPIDGLEQVYYITSDDVLALAEAPRSLMILGAGPVGLEMAEVFARVGTDVMVAERGSVLDDFDPEFGAEFQRYVEAEPRLTLWTQAQVTQVRANGSGTGVTCVIDVDGQRREHAADSLLVATGRQPDLEGLGLEHLGLTLEHGRLQVNSAMQTANPNVFLAGDVVGPQILHIAAEEGRVAGHNAAVGAAEQTVDYVRQDLTIIFTSLTAARTGLTETQARQAGRIIATAGDRPARSGRGITDKDAFGLWKLVADADTGKILGAQILETQADATIHLVKMAMDTGLTVGDLSRMVAYHPTRVERLKGLAHTICTHLRMPSGLAFCPQ